MAPEIKSATAYLIFACLLFLYTIVHLHKNETLLAILDSSHLIDM